MGRPKETYIEQYINQTTEQRLIPSWENYCVFLMKEKKFKNDRINKLNKNELKEHIFIYAKSKIMEQITFDNRNKPAYIKLLELLNNDFNNNEQNKKNNEISIDINFNSDSKDGNNLVPNDKKI